MIKSSQRILIISILLLCLSFVFKSDKDSASPSIIGLWADSNSSSFTNCYAIFSEKKGKLYFSHYLEFNGQPMVEHGTGTFKNGIAQYNVTVSKGIEGWSMKGKHMLVLTPDGKTLRGKYADEMGKTGPLVFKRIK